MFKLHIVYTIYIYSKVEKGIHIFISLLILMNNQAVDGTFMRKKLISRSISFSGTNKSQIKILSQLLKPD